MIKHINSGSCEKCQQIIYEFKGPTPPHPDLITFFNHVVSLNKDCHVAYVGRGEAEQNEFFAKKTSKAKWGQSPHNYNLAIDFFRLTLTGADWPREWFAEIAKEITNFPTIEWGGSWATFQDKPHFQIKTWKELVASGQAKLVQPNSSTNHQSSDLIPK